MSMPRQSVWVLGAGFLGTELARQGQAAGMQTLTVDEKSAADIQGDAGDPSTLSRAVSRLAPTAAVCCMSTHGGSPSDYLRTYLNPARLLAEKLPATRLIFCSSTSVYGETRGRLVDENTPPVAAAGCRDILLQAEEAVLKAGGWVIRLAALYGPGRCELLRRHLAREPRLPGREGRHFNYLHVEDAARAILALAGLQGTAPRLYQACSETFTKQEAYETLEQLTGIAASQESALPGARGKSDSMVDCSRLRSIGWRPRHRFKDFVRSQMMG